MFKRLKNQNSGLIVERWIVLIIFRVPESAHRYNKQFKGILHYGVLIIEDPQKIFFSICTKCDSFYDLSNFLGYAPVLIVRLKMKSLL